ncbi:hypothetical protein SFRURICE_015537 [Spodoptera frugiperda]|nr:hypothetical protein SFRURICE_015537 [Spodoptera frugiperda]
MVTDKTLNPASYLLNIRKHINTIPKLESHYMVKSEPFHFYYKTSYSDTNFKQVDIRNKRKKMDPITAITLDKAYSQRQQLSENKKKDLKELLTKKLIPSFYASFYNSIV